MSETFNMEAEEKAIVTILNGDPDISGLTLGKIRQEYFAADESAQILTRIFTLVKNNKKLPSLDVFIEDPVLTDTTKDFLTNIKIRNVPFLTKIEDVDSLVETLSFYHRKRMLYNGVRDLTKILKAPLDTLDPAVNRIDQILQDIRTETQESKLIVAGDGDSTHADEIVTKILNQDEKSTNVLTSFGFFDRLCGGFPKPGLIIISGTTGGGKSLMRTQLAKNMYMDQHLNTCIVSLEMSKEEEMMRLLSNVSKVPFEKIRNHQLSFTQQDKVLKAWENFKKAGQEHQNRFIFWVPENVEITAQSIIAYLKPQALDVLVVDYISLVSGSGNKRQEAQWETLGEIAKEFKKASQALGICIILLAQFDADNNRIKYSRAIQEHCNILWGWQVGDKERETGIVEIQQIKNRNANPTNFNLHFQFDIMTIEDYQGFEEGTKSSPVDLEKKLQNVEFKNDKPKSKDHITFNYPTNLKDLKNDIKHEVKASTYAPPKTMGGLDMDDSDL